MGQEPDAEPEPMTRQELLDQLLAAPKHLFAAEAGLLNAEQCHRSAREALADREASLLISGVEGRNEPQRQAHLREQTESLRAQVEETRVHVEFLRLSAEKERAQFSSLRAVAKLMAVEDTGLAEVIGKLEQLSAVMEQAHSELGMHMARLEERQEAHEKELMGLVGSQGDVLREAEASAAVATRLLAIEETVSRHSEAICRLLLVTAPLKEPGERRELPSMEVGS